MPYPQKATADPNDLMNGEREIGTTCAHFSGDHIARYRFAQSLLPPGAKVLDIGCGVGYGSALLAQAAQSVIGIDLRPHVVAFAQQHWTRPNVTFLVGDALNINHYPNEKFDVIVAFEIIEHLPDDAHFIGILANHLQPNGILCVSAPNLEVMPHPEENPWHYRHYLPAQLRSLLKQRFDQVAEFTTVGKLVKPGSGGHSIVMVAYQRWPQRYTIGFISQEYPSPPSRQYPPSGGVGTYTSLMARALARRGHEIHVIARASDTDTHHTYPDDRVTVHRVVNDAPVTNRVALRVLGKAASLLPRWKALRKYISDVNVSFDLVETAEWSAEALLCTKLRQQVAVVTRLHTPTYVVQEASGSKPSWQVKWAEKIHAHLADAITAPSMSIADLCRHDWRLRRVDVIVNPIDVNSEAAVIRERPDVLGYLPGRFDTYKGFPVLVKALEQFLEEGCHAGLSILLVGSNYTDDYMKHLLSRLEPWISRDNGGSNRPIKVLPRQPYGALQQLMNDIDVIILTSRYENAPYVVLEAMAMGKLVVAPHVGGLPEIIRDRVNGLLFKPGDAQALALSLKWAIEHPSEVYTIRHQAHVSVREYFSFDRWIATYEVYYAHIIGKKRMSDQERRPFGWWLPMNGQLLPDWMHRIKARWRRKQKG